jgi:hypothetical protein
MGPHQLLALLSTVPQADPLSSFTRRGKMTDKDIQNQGNAAHEAMNTCLHIYT